MLCRASLLSVFPQYCSNGHKNLLEPSNSPPRLWLVTTLLLHWEGWSKNLAENEIRTKSFFSVSIWIKNCFELVATEQNLSEDLYLVFTVYSIIIESILVLAGFLNVTKGACGLDFAPFPLCKILLNTRARPITGPSRYIVSAFYHR